MASIVKMIDNLYTTTEELRVFAMHNDIYGEVALNSGAMLKKVADSYLAMICQNDNCEENTKTNNFNQAMLFFNELVQGTQNHYLTDKQKKLSKIGNEINQCATNATDKDKKLLLDIFEDKLLEYNGGL